MKILMGIPTPRGNVEGVSQSEIELKIDKLYVNVLICVISTL